MTKLDFSKGRLRAFTKRPPAPPPNAVPDVLQDVAFAHGANWDEETAKEIRKILEKRLPQGGLIKLYEYPPRQA